LETGRKIKFLLAALLLASLSACNEDSGKINGYVEGEFLRIAPTTGGILQTLSVARGDDVKAGDELFSIDLTALTAQRDSDKALLEQAQAKWADLTKGKRPEEIAVITQQKAQAAADLENARKEYDRTTALIEKDATSVKQRDEAKAAYERAAARVAEIEANLKVAVLGGRDDERAAAKAAVDAAAQKVTGDERLLREAAPKAAAAGKIEDTFYLAGEFVQAGAPVVSLLPPENVKIRFFVSQKILPQLQSGRKISVSCDGCKGAVTATISFLSNQAEFTPPIIYSVESRDKLVFLVEAKPDAFDPALRPGLPVDVSLAAP
jgi:HlyD family secretion protein